MGSRTYTFLVKAICSSIGEVNVLAVYLSVLADQRTLFTTFKIHSSAIAQCAVC